MIEAPAPGEPDPAPAPDLPLTAVQRTLAAQTDGFALGRWTPSEVLEAYARRIARLNPLLNAVVDTRLEAAREEAAASTERWARGEPRSDVDGATVLVKANIAVDGLPWTAGVQAYERRIARADAEAVARLKAAGAVIVGTLNMEEGALGAVTDNPWLGRCLNPWGAPNGARGASDLTPGGSSGGSGAAAAAGLSAATLGTDTMGSVRIPAAYCGVTGHKPSRGLIPTGGVTPLSHTLDHVGPLTRSARDLAALTNALAGERIDSRFAFAGRVIGRWRFEDAVECDAEVYRLYEQVIERARDAGARIVDVKPKHYQYAKSRRRGLLISELEGWAEHEDAIEAVPDGFSQTFRDLLHWGASQTADKAERGYEAVRACEGDAQAWFADVDIVLAPTALEPAFDFESDPPAGQADLTAFADFAGVPATAVCAGLTEAGLPASVQVIGPTGFDGRTIAAAAAIENAAAGPFIPPGY